MKDSKLQYLLNDGLKEVLLTSAKSLSQGKNTIRVEFAEDKKVTLFVNNEKAAEQNIENRNKYLNSAASDGFSIGKDLNSPVTKSYGGTFAFSGAVKSLVIEQNEGDKGATGR